MRGRKPAHIAPGSSTVIAIPAPPRYLSKDAKAEWKRVAPILIEERRTLTVADMMTLTAYCIASGRLAEAERIIEREGPIFTSKTGPRKHPAVAISSDAMTQMRLLAGELGVTPVARSRAAATEAVDDGAADLGLD